MVVWRKISIDTLTTNLERWGSKIRFSNIRHTIIALSPQRYWKSYSHNGSPWILNLLTAATLKRHSSWPSGCLFTVNPRNIANGIRKIKWVTKRMIGSGNCDWYLDSFHFNNVIGWSYYLCTIYVTYSEVLSKFACTTYPIVSHSGACHRVCHSSHKHYNDVIMSAMASQITSLTIEYSTVYSGADKRKHQSSASLPSWGEFTGDRWIPAQRARNAENVSVWWRQH